MSQKHTDDLEELLRSLEADLEAIRNRADIEPESKPEPEPVAPAAEPVKPAPAAESVKVAPVASAPTASAPTKQPRASKAESAATPTETPDMAERFQLAEMDVDPLPAVRRGGELAVAEDEMEPLPLPAPKKGKRALSILFNVIFFAAIIGMLGGSILFALSNDPKKSYFGKYRIYTVLTDSMKPLADGSSPPGGFSKGAIILVEMCEPEDVQVGDVITFNPNPRAKDDNGRANLTHRVKEIKYDLNGQPGVYYVTQGDHNPSEDPPVNSTMLIGKKIAHIPGVGGFLKNVRENFVLAIVMLVALFGCIFALRFYFAKPGGKAAKSKESSRK